MLGYTEYVLAEGSFSYGQAVAVITAYRNVFIQDDPGIRRQLVLPTRANYTGRTLQCDIKSR
ncbi:DUF905 family protein, partial [Escherichia coli]